MIASQRDLRSAFSSTTISCPSPEHDDETPSCSIYADHAFCHGCRRRFSLEEVVTLLGLDASTLRPLTEPVPARHRNPDIPSEVMIEVWAATLTDPASPLRHRIAWLRQRGLFHETIRSARLGHTGRAFSIPILSARGDYLSVKFRRDDSLTTADAPKYLTPRGVGPLLYRPNASGSPSVICEGELDALLLAQYGIDAMTSTHGAATVAGVVLGARLRQDVYIATDNDAAGEAAADDIQTRLRSLPHTRRLTRIKLRAKDVTDELAPLGDEARRERLWQWFTGGAT